jgi:Flp pilus assembly protein TadD
MQRPSISDCFGVEELVKIAKSFMANEFFLFAKKVALEILLLEPRNAAAQQILQNTEDFLPSVVTLEYLNEAAMLNPLDEEIQHSLAVSYFMLRDLSLSLHHAEQAYELNPSEPKWLMTLVRVLSELRYHRSCIRYAEEFHSKHELDLGVQCDYMFALAEEGMFKEALEASETYYHLAPDDAITMNNLGYLQYLVGNMDEALKLSALAIRMDSKLPYAHNNYGLVLGLRGEFHAALQSINHSLELEPSNSFAYRNRAIVYHHMQREKECEQDQNRAKALFYEEQYGELRLENGERGIERGE